MLWWGLDRGGDECVLLDEVGGNDWLGEGLIWLMLVRHGLEGDVWDKMGFEAWDGNTTQMLHIVWAVRVKAMLTMEIKLSLHWTLLKQSVVYKW